MRDYTFRRISTICLLETTHLGGLSTVGLSETTHLGGLSTV